MQDEQWHIGPDTPWRFGTRHKGTPVRLLPLDYLVWVAKNFRKGPAKRACQRQIALKDPALARKMKIKIDDGYVQGRYDCSSHFNPLSEFPGEQEWNGIDAPWIDQRSEVDLEFARIIREICMSRTAIQPVDES